MATRKRSQSTGAFREELREMLNRVEDNMQQAAASVAEEAAAKAIALHRQRTQLAGLKDATCRALQEIGAAVADPGQGGGVSRWSACL
jgi:hypothetical protein